MRCLVTRRQVCLDSCTFLGLMLNLNLRLKKKHIFLDSQTLYLSLLYRTHYAYCLASNFDGAKNWRNITSFKTARSWIVASWVFEYQRQLSWVAVATHDNWHWYPNIIWLSFDLTPTANIAKINPQANISLYTRTV